MTHLLSTHKYEEVENPQRAIINSKVWRLEHLAHQAVVTRYYGQCNKDSLSSQLLLVSIEMLHGAMIKLS